MSTVGNTIALPVDEEKRTLDATSEPQSGFGFDLLQITQIIVTLTVVLSRGTAEGQQAFLIDAMDVTLKQSSGTRGSKPTVKTSAVEGRDVDPQSSHVVASARAQKTRVGSTDQNWGSIETTSDERPRDYIG
jgi:hypothetical protein